MIRRPPRSTQSRSSAASDVYKRQLPYRFFKANHPFLPDIVAKNPGVGSISARMGVANTKSRGAGIAGHHNPWLAHYLLNVFLSHSGEKPAGTTPQVDFYY